MKRHAALPHLGARRLYGTDPPVRLRGVLGIQDEQVFLTESGANTRGRIFGEERSIHSVACATGRPRTMVKTYLKTRRTHDITRIRSRQNTWFEARLRDVANYDLSLRRRDRRTAKAFQEGRVAEGYMRSYSPVQRFVREFMTSSGADACIPLHVAPGDALPCDPNKIYGPIRWCL